MTAGLWGFQRGRLVARPDIVPRVALTRLAGSAVGDRQGVAWRVCRLLWVTEVPTGVGWNNGSRSHAMACDGHFR